MAGSQGLLWTALIASGLYHGLNPAMGWPLAVSAGLWTKKTSSLARAMLLLGVGHLLAMCLVLLPMALLTRLIFRLTEIRISAGAFVVAFGLWRLLQPRHPRALARIHPSRLILWSFLMATAHGAALLLVPVYLGMSPSNGHHVHTVVSNAPLSPLVSAALVSIVHTLTMTLAGGAIAWLIFRHLGLRFLRTGWLNLDTIWALSLIVSGAAGVLSALS